MRVVELYDRLRAEFETSPTQQPDIEAVRQLLVSSQVIRSCFVIHGPILRGCL